MVVVTKYSTAYTSKRCQTTFAERRKPQKLRQRIYGVSGLFDKLELFGFSIHGCIDRYSRRSIYLEEPVSNNSPSLIVCCYLAAAKNLNRIPKIV